MFVGARQHSLPTSRNRDPILAVLKRVLPARSGQVRIVDPTHVLEIASGTGEHAVYFANAMPHLRWQPSDPDATSRASIAAWIAAEGVSNVAPPIDLNMMGEGWAEVADKQPFDAVVAINMIHISPWEATKGLMFCASGLLASARHKLGILYTYGPYKRGGQHTAPSNESFDAWLKERDPRYGVRDLEEVEAAANAEGLRLREIIEMPANNLSLVFEL